jgi:hypothetical protein
MKLKPPERVLKTRVIRKVRSTTIRAVEPELRRRAAYLLRCFASLFERYKPILQRISVCSTRVSVGWYLLFDNVRNSGYNRLRGNLAAKNP